MLELAASAELSSGHPLANAIVEAARVKGLYLSLPDHVETIAGKGIVAESPNIAVGNEALAQSLGILLSAKAPDLLSESTRLAAEGKTVMFVFDNRAPIGLTAVADQPRPESRAVVDTLRKMGIDVALVTGDNRSTADAIAHSCRISRPFGGPSQRRPLLSKAFRLLAEKSQWLATSKRCAGSCESMLALQ